MNPEYIYCEQQSEEWFKVRLGLLTASHFSEVLNKGSGRKTYMLRLLAERMAGEVHPAFSNEYMKNGIETEPFAREYYEGLKKVKVEQVGFIKTGDIGCSPDGLVGDDGIIEIKCPLPSTHLGYILQDKMPTVYIPQVQGNLMVSGRQWCDFISFDPKVTKRPFWSIRVKRDENYINNILRKATEQFLYELKSLEQKLGLPF